MSEVHSEVDNPLGVAEELETEIGRINDVVKHEKKRLENIYALNNSPQSKIKFR